MKTRNLAVAAGVSLGLLGCQLLLATDRTQCATDADCAAKSGAPLVCRDAVCVASSTLTPTSTDAGSDDAGVDLTTPWGCLADPPPRVPEDRSQPLTVRERFMVYSMLDCQHNRPVAGAEVKLCSQRDVSCGSPVETLMTDCEGYANFKAAYRGFEGYILVDPPKPGTNDAGAPAWSSVTTKCFEDLYEEEVAEGRSGERCAIQKDGAGEVIVPLPSDLVPSIVSIVPPPAESADPNGVIPQGPPIISAGTLTSLLALVGKAFDPKAGHLTAVGADCQGLPTHGVTMSVTGAIGPNSQLYYMDSQGMPNVNQGETSEYGGAGYLNLDPGVNGMSVVSVTATRHATNQRIGLYAVLIRSGYISFLGMHPLKN